MESVSFYSAPLLNDYTRSLIIEEIRKSKRVFRRPHKLCYEEINKKRATERVVVTNFYNEFKKLFIIDYERETERKREIVSLRQLAQYFAYNFRLATLSIIAEVIGNKGHATIYNSVNQVKNSYSGNYTIFDIIYIRESGVKELFTINKTFSVKEKYSTLVDYAEEYLKSKDYSAFKFNQTENNENNNLIIDDLPEFVSNDEVGLPHDLFC